MSTAEDETAVQEGCQMIPSYRHQSPPEIYLLIKEGILTRGEAFLLHHINDLVHEDDGCYATNSYLAELHGVTTRRVIQIITKLVQLGYVRKFLVKDHPKGRNRRIMETLWNRCKLSAGRGEIDFTARVKSISPRPIYGMSTNNKQDSAADPVPAAPARKSAGCLAVDHMRAEALKDMVHRYYSGKSISVDQWAKEFAILRRRYKDKVRKILNWLISNYERRVELFIPRVNHIRKFKEKFEQIEEAMERIAKEQNAGLSKDITVSDEAKRLARILATEQWPKGVDQHLPVAVELTLQFYMKFLTDLKRFDLKLAKAILKYPMMRENFVKSWWGQIRKEVVNWNRWSGNMAQYIPRLDSKYFLTFGRALAAQKGFRSTDFDFLVENMKCTTE